MTPKEKCVELTQKFYNLTTDQFTDGSMEATRLCMLYVIEQIETITRHYPPDYMLTSYWQEVKNEIEKL